MRRISPLFVAVLALSFAVISPVSAAPGQGAQQSGQGEQQSGQQGEQEQRPRYEERIVVTASRIEQLLLDAPVAITILDSALIETAPAGNYADLLRGVPGLNVSQTSARDISITSRAPTNTLATSQLVLMDGRTVYQDFFGFVLWDLLPVSFNEIEQIEVQRGPSSAVWGANAMTGVVNIITKSPRSLGNSLSVRGGGGEVGTGFFSVLNSGVSEKLAYRVSGSYYQQDAWDRPANFSGAVFPDGNNRGTKQPKIDGRVDYQLAPRSEISFAGGYAGTGGIIFSGLGPFDIEDGSWFGYVRADYNRNDANIRFYANLLSADAFNLLSPLDFDFDTGTYDFSAQNTSIVQDGKHVFVYGGNFRYLTNELSIARNADNRREGGVFIQDSWAPTEQLLINAGVRVDGFTSIDNPVWSPRVGFQVRPFEGLSHAVRVSWGRAFRAPSVINNFLETTVFNTIDLSRIVPGLAYSFPLAAAGNPDLVEERLDQIEIGYRAVVDRVAIDFAWYRTETNDNIDFYASRFYSPAAPPPAWPLPPIVLALLPQPLPQQFTYRNIGIVRTQGVEFGLRGRVDNTELYGTYTWQKRREAEELNPDELNVSPAHLFTVGLNGDYRGVFYSATLNYQGEAFWADVLDARFHGITDAATTLNMTLGYNYGDVGFSMRATNLTNVEFQQHHVGDVIGRRIVGEATVNFNWADR